MTSEPDVLAPHELPIRLSQNPAADALLVRSPFALLLGMLLDQQFPMERAFAGPYVVSERIGHDIDVREIAGYDPEQLTEIMSQSPAVHRYPKAMAIRAQQLARYLVEHHDADPTLLWREATTGDALVQRVNAMPGFGKQKARILVALLGKQFGITPHGWRDAAGDYGAEGVHLSIADVTGPESLAEVRAAKRERKIAMRAKATRVKARRDRADDVGQEHASSEQHRAVGPEHEGAT